MYNVPNVYVGSFAELTTLDNKLITSGKITKIGTDFIEVSNGFRTHKIRNELDAVKVNIKSSNFPALYLTGKIYLPSLESFRMIDLDVISEGEHRNFFRLSIDEDVEISSTRSNELDIGKLLDISLGGAKVQSDKSYTIGDLLVIALPHKNDVLRVIGSVVRVNEGKPFNSYGVSFKQLAPKTSDDLCNYVFDRQKAEISRLKNT